MSDLASWLRAQLDWAQTDAAEDHTVADRDAVFGLRQGSFEVNGTFDGFFPPPPMTPRRLTYIVPRRPHWWGRWQVVEYTGQVVPDAPTTVDGDVSVSFTVVGPLTQRIHTARFWLLWRAKRYIRREWEERQ